VRYEALRGVCAPAVGSSGFFTNRRLEKFDLHEHECEGGLTTASIGSVGASSRSLGAFSPALYCTRNPQWV
jgi:hypothetical protein